MSYIGNSPGVASQRVTTTLTATAGQTQFTTQSGYVLGYVDVYLNGAKLVNGADFEAITGTFITLFTGAAVGDVVELISYVPRGLSDGYTKAEADAKFLDVGGDTASGAISLGTNGLVVGTNQLVASGGNIGIGTDSPVDIFQVQKNQNASTNVYISNSNAGGSARTRLILNSDNGAGNISIGQHSSSHSSAANQGWIWTSGASSPLVLGTLGTARVTISTDGKIAFGPVGFQTQSPAGSLSFPQGASLQTGGFGRAWNPAQQIGQGSNSGLYGMAHTYLAYYDAGWKSLGGGTASAITIDEGNFSFSNTNGVGASNSALSWTTRMFINTSGNIGMGTVSPATRLEIREDTSSRNTVTNMLTLHNYSATNPYDGFGNGIVFKGLDYSNAPQTYASIVGGIYNTSRSTPQPDIGFSGILKFLTGTNGANAERMSISSSQMLVNVPVGIGTGTPTQFSTRFSIVGTSSADEIVLSATTGYSSGWTNSRLRLGAYNANGYLGADIFATSNYNQTTGTSLSFATSPAGVAATTTPIERMRITSDGTIQKYGTNGNMYIMDGNTAGGVKIAAYAANFTSNGYLAFEGYSYEYARFNATGNFGIGNTAVPTKLSINSPVHDSPSQPGRVLNWYGVTGFSEIWNTDTSISVGNNNASTTQPTHIGLSLFNTNTANNTWSPAVTFNALSTNGNYMNGTAAIAAQLLDNPEDSNFRGGDLHFFTSGVTSNSRGLTSKLVITAGGNATFLSPTAAVRVNNGTTAQRPTPAAGAMRWNTSLAQLEVADGTNFKKVTTETIANATGGTVTTDGDYYVHTFYSSGTFNLTTVSGGNKADLQVLVVGGGGGGGFYLGGGGGGGAMLEKTISVATGTYTVTVGAGGSSINSGYTYSTNGGASSVTGGTLGATEVYVFGGGAGGNGAANDAWGANGYAQGVGCGGGGGSPYGFSAANHMVHACAGGSAGRNGSGGGAGSMYSSLTFTGGGGGGGALSAGITPVVGNGPVGVGGWGGSGMTSTISGSSAAYGGGGGGGYGTYNANGGISGGSGGGGYGVGSANSGGNLQAAAGTTNTGGGGGGGQYYSGYQQGGAGGSGIVIIRYKFR